MSEAAFPVPVQVDADKGAPPRNRPGLGIRIRRRLPGIASVLVMAFALLILFGPVLMLALFSFNDSSIISLPWEGFTTRWYEEAWDSAEAARRDPQLAARRLAGHDRLARPRDDRRLGPDAAAVPRPRRARRPARVGARRALADHRRRRA